MLDNLYFADDISKRYRCSMDTARRYMRQMGAIGTPLMVTERMIIAWEAKRRVQGVMKIPRRCG